MITKRIAVVFLVAGLIVPPTVLLGLSRAWGNDLDDYEAQLASGPVSIARGNQGDNASKAGRKQDITFRVLDQLSDVLGHKVKSREAKDYGWNITITDENGEIFYQQGGANQPPEEIQWNGQSGAGGWIKADHVYSVGYSFTDPSGRIYTRAGPPLNPDAAKLRSRTVQEASLNSSHQGDDAFAAYLKTNYSLALQLAQPAAQGGDFLAQYTMGAIYTEGKVVPQDKTAAKTWLKRALSQATPAAQKGDPRAQLVVGLMYVKTGQPKGYAQAAVWYRKAAEQGNVFAQLALGVLYEGGTGVPKDYNEAASWYRKAAAQGNDMAQTMLSVVTKTMRAAAEKKPAAHKIAPGIQSSRLKKSEASQFHDEAELDDQASKPAGEKMGQGAQGLMGSAKAVPFGELKCSIAIFLGTDVCAASDTGALARKWAKCPIGANEFEIERNKNLVTRRYEDARNKVYYLKLPTEHWSVLDDAGDMTTDGFSFGEYDFQNKRFPVNQPTIRAVGRNQGGYSRVALHFTPPLTYPFDSIELPEDKAERLAKTQGRMIPVTVYFRLTAFKSTLHFMPDSLEGGECGYTAEVLAVKYFTPDKGVVIR
jgi:TPR repeat protein